MFIKHLEDAKDIVLSSLNLENSPYSRELLESKILSNLSKITGKRTSRMRASSLLKETVLSYHQNLPEKRPFITMDSLAVTSMPLNQKHEEHLLKCQGFLKNLRRDSLPLSEHIVILLQYISFYDEDVNGEILVNPYLFGQFFNNLIDSFQTLEECQAAASKTSWFTSIINFSDYLATRRGMRISKINKPREMLREAQEIAGAKDGPEVSKIYDNLARYVSSEFSYEQLLVIESKFIKSLDICKDSNISAMAAVLTNRVSDDGPDRLDESWYVKSPTKELGYTKENIKSILNDYTVSIYSVLRAIEVGMTMELFSMLDYPGERAIIEYVQAFRSSGIQMNEANNSQISWVKTWVAEYK